MIEKRFEQIKTVHEIAPVFLKDEGRIEALFTLYFLALLVQPRRGGMHPRHRRSDPNGTPASVCLWALFSPVLTVSKWPIRVRWLMHSANVWPPTHMGAQPMPPLQLWDMQGAADHQRAGRSEYCYQWMELPRPNMNDSQP